MAPLRENSSLLKPAAAALDGVNISLNTLDREKFRFITGSDDLAYVLEGMEAALNAGKGLHFKVNCVLQQGMNDDEWPAIAALVEDRRPGRVF